MRLLSRPRARIIVPSIIAAIGLAVAAGTAFANGQNAGTLTKPVVQPFVAVQGDGSGRPLTFDISGDNFPVNASIFAEICDGTPDSTTVPAWSPTTNCDLGSSGAPISTDGTGHFDILASDSSHHVRVFNGPSPQGLFDCVAPSDPAANTPGFTNGITTDDNGLPIWTNCQLRVSTNNENFTADQALATLILPTAPPSPVEVVPFILNAPGSFDVKIAGGRNTTHLSLDGVLPTGLTFTDNGNGDGTIAGTPTVAAPKFVTVYSTSPDAVQQFTVIAGKVPTFPLANPTVLFTADVAKIFTIAAPGTGGPTDYSEVGGLPPGLTWTTTSNGHATVSGTPTDAAPGNYSLTVTAHNMFGTAVRTFAITVNKHAPAPVTNLVLTSPLAGTIHATWTPPAFNGGSAITSYKLTVKLGTVVKKTVLVPAPASSTSPDISGLVSGSSYTVTITAITAFSPAGGPPLVSTPITVT
jgi:hypothetical protein